MTNGRQGAAVSKADERRLNIVNRSALLFDRKGADQVSMSDIAEDVGLAKPSLYHYFSSKDEILNSIHVNTIEFLLDGIRRRRATDASPDVVLRGVLGDIFSLMETHPGHIRVFFESARRLPPDLLEPVRKREREYDQLVLETIEQAIEDGYFRAVNSRSAAFAFFGMANWAAHWYRPGGTKRAEQFAEEFFDLFLNGVTARRR
ncbi:TetR/AcrR family transcriptional regulator [Pseudonocardia halophobica]|uniref:TetR family transcriptional regulator n=1 Tax=Pseudonocardia halophobica TaxID=29401 RepID=A0A9W6KXC2_9PSEU|nr:TetR/AcrR family transcriptional regulator [Pseudonocardia halophobica]GLL09782.1 TetR family transcriptional regulator [Pseudonocardia halophobica]